LFAESQLKKNEELLIQEKVSGIIYENSQLVINSESKSEAPALPIEEKKRIIEKDILNLNEDSPARRKHITE